MRLTQGTFSFLPPLTDDQVRKQIQYALDNGWPVSIEYTDDPHPRNAEHPHEYVKLNAYDARLGRQTTALSFLVHRPSNEKGFRLERTTDKDRQLKYKLHPYAADKPQGERYTEE